MEAHVATVTGGAFGAPDCLRISYAASEEQLRTAVSPDLRSAGQTALVAANVVVGIAGVADGYQAAVFRPLNGLDDRHGADLAELIAQRA